MMIAMPVITMIIVSIIAVGVSVTGGRTMNGVCLVLETTGGMRGVASSLHVRESGYLRYLLITSINSSAASVRSAPLAELVGNR